MTSPVLLPWSPLNAYQQSESTHCGLIVCSQDAVHAMAHTFTDLRKLGTFGAVSKSQYTTGVDMNATLTDHASARLQQRGIPRAILDRLLSYGQKIHDHHGAEVVFFDRKARQLLRDACGIGEFKKIEPKLDTYAVIGGDGIVITVGQRTKRINRN